MGENRTHPRVRLSTVYMELPQENMGDPILAEFDDIDEAFEDDFWDTIVPQRR